MWLTFFSRRKNEIKVNLITPCGLRALQPSISPNDDAKNLSGRIYDTYVLHGCVF